MINYLLVFPVVGALVMGYVQVNDVGATCLDVWLRVVHGPV